MKRAVSIGVLAAGTALALPAAWSARGEFQPPAGETSGDPAHAPPAASSGSSGRQETGRRVGGGDLDSLHAYIRQAWSTLTRSNRDLAAAAVDPKFPPPSGKRWPVYVSRGDSFDGVSAELAGLLPPAELAKIVLLRLPRNWNEIEQPGLLYLPRPYVVPGGRFNEMYGWDSYFILRGLVRDGQMNRARDLVDDAVYEVLSFGKVLNANRTYYLQRSQPPFLTRMIRAVYRGEIDRAWLASTLPAIRAQYDYWTNDPHLAGDTGLSRYRALGNGPAPEVQAGEKDAAGRDHYDRVREALRDQRLSPDFDVSKYYDRQDNRLTALAYVADRSVRESGFDPSDRFGPFSLPILDFAPVCLNSLLYVMERDMAAFLTMLGGVFEAQAWARLADQRRERMQRVLWDAGRGLFLDYDFVNARRRFYPFATVFFPLWAGAATPEQARQVAERGLELLEEEGGLATSAEVTGKQWDAPFGWAPLQLIAVEGLRAYGLDEQANRISLKFLGTVLKEFAEHGGVFEKYDVKRRESDVAAGLKFGYSSNEIGFGWTNAAFLELEAGLPPGERTKIVDAARAQ